MEVVRELTSPRFAGLLRLTVPPQVFLLDNPLSPEKNRVFAPTRETSCVSSLSRRREGKGCPVGLVPSPRSAGFLMRASVSCHARSMNLDSA